MQNLNFIFSERQKNLLPLMISMPGAAHQVRKFDGVKGDSQLASIDEMKDFVVHVVDDDADILESLEKLFELNGIKFVGYLSAEEFLVHFPNQRPSCVLIDERLSGMQGRELLEHLVRRGFDCPVIMFSAFADANLAVTALRQGALTVLEKPVSDDELFRALEEAFVVERKRLEDRQRFEAMTEKYLSLNDGEKVVMSRIVKGEQNKGIAYDLGVSLRTVELRRHNVFQKLSVEGVADLVKFCILFEDLTQKYENISRIQREN